MKRKLLIIVFGTLTVVAVAVAMSALIPLHRERLRIGERVETLRRALRSNDVTGVASIVCLKMRAKYENQNGL